MKNLKLILGCASAFAVASAIVPAHGQETAPAQEQAPVVQSTKPNAVLFKIHDIEPVLDEEGGIISCNFTATFFNRTPNSLRQAKMDLVWKDAISGRFAVEEPELPKLETPQQPENQGNVAPVVREPSQTAPERPGPRPTGDIIASIEVPLLSSHRHAVVKGNVETDRCFALLDNLTFSVPVCNMLHKDLDENSRQARLEASKEELGCAGLFQYVNAQNPEYYEEFKDISYSDQSELDAKTEEQDLAAIKESTEKLKQNLEKTITLIGNIK